jgi:hypothetical protein
MTTNGTADVAISSFDAAGSLGDNDNSPLIGGIVGGVVALLLIGGLIAFLVARSRRRGKSESNDAPLQPLPNNDVGGGGVASHRVNNNYGALTLSDGPQKQNNYNATSPGALHNYDAWNDDHGKPKASPNRTEYEQGNLNLN